MDERTGQQAQTQNMGGGNGVSAAGEKNLDHLLQVKPTMLANMATFKFSESPEVGPSRPNGQQQQQDRQAQGNLVAAGAGVSMAMVGGGLPTHLLPHRKPKNFADRLMRVLLNGEGGDTLW